MWEESKESSGTGCRMCDRRKSSQRFGIGDDRAQPCAHLERLGLCRISPLLESSLQNFFTSLATHFLFHVVGITMLTLPPPESAWEASVHM